MADWETPPSTAKDGWEAPPAKPAASPGFPYDKPGTTYGEILPFSEDTKTGKLEFAFPEAIRSPLRGAISGGEKIRGVRPVDSSAPVSPEETGAAMAFGGVSKPPGGGGMGGPRTMQARSIPEGYNILRDTAPPRADKFGVPVSQDKIPASYDPARDVTRPTGTQGGPSIESKTIPELFDPMSNTVAPSKPGVLLHAAVARKAGYVLEPQSVSETPGMVAKLASSPAGRVKLRQKASIRNQEVTNDLAAEDLGVPKGTTLTDRVFDAVRNKASQVYKAIVEFKPSMAPDKTFLEDASGLGGTKSLVGKHFPGLVKNQGIETLREELKLAQEAPTQAWIDLVRKFRHESNQALRTDDPEKHALGLAKREAADAIDAMIERRLSETNIDPRFPHLPALGTKGRPDLASKYREARQTIAKSYDYEGATNLATGDVRAQGLAKLSSQGRPLTGNAATIAQTAQAFPHVVQDVARVGGEEAHSVIDFFTAGAALAHGKPGLALAIAGRPLSRTGLLSKSYQDRLTRPPAQPRPNPSMLGAVPGMVSPNVSDAVNPPVPNPFNYEHRENLS